MPNGLRERLIAATTKWRMLDSERDDARDEVLDAATAMLKAGAPPAEVVTLTPFSNALVRRETRERGAPKAARGPKRKEESKSAGARPPMPVGPDFELVASIAALPPERAASLLARLRNQHTTWFRTARQATTELKGDERTSVILAMAVEAKCLTEQEVNGD